jgi:hypothetical protein
MYHKAHGPLQFFGRGAWARPLPGKREAYNLSHASENCLPLLDQEERENGQLLNDTNYKYIFLEMRIMTFKKN